MDGNETSECEEDTFSDNGGGDKARNLTGTGLMEQERLMEIHKQGAIRHCPCENHKM